MKVKVYRLEKNARGPYIDPPDDLSEKDQTILDRMNILHSMSKDKNGKFKHPSLFFDFVNPDFSLICGFKDLKDLKTWFRGFLAPLKRMGFTIQTYTVDTKWIQYGKSDKQLMFLP